MCQSDDFPLLQPQLPSWKLNSKCPKQNPHFSPQTSFPHLRRGEFHFLNGSVSLCLCHGPIDQQIPQGSGHSPHCYFTGPKLPSPFFFKVRIVLLKDSHAIYTICYLKCTITQWFPVYSHRCAQSLARFQNTSSPPD